MTRTPEQEARSILGIMEDVIVKKEDVDALIQWVKKNQGKKIQEADFNPLWLKWEGRWGYTQAWPMIHFELGCGGYGNTDYYQVIPLDSFLIRHDTTIELLKFLAAGAKYDKQSLTEAQRVGMELQKMSTQLDELMLLTKLPQVLRSVYYSKFTEDD